MKESFLHYIWKYKKFDFLNLKTINNEQLTVLNSGQFTELQGPDFFNAQIEIENQKWAGNIEIHIKSSDWYTHRHELDSNYDNVILHVVWEHDVDIFRQNNTVVPVLVLKDYVSSETIQAYNNLSSKKSWIYCENELKTVPEFVLKNWQERLFFERLERKTVEINVLLKQSNNDWESVLFFMLAKNFGLNTNGSSFLEIASKITFQVIRKESFEVENSEALLFGFAGLLQIEKEDIYFNDLKFRFLYLINKHQLDISVLQNVTFFKHRPDNFPTIRLSQFANLLHTQQNLFSKIINENNLLEIYNLFKVNVSQYWKSHYQFDNLSPSKSKKLSQSFIDLVVVNTIIPLKFAFAKHNSQDINEDLIAILDKIKPESNGVINKFSSFGLSVKSAFETQSLLQLKNEYCDKNKCLECAIGLELLKN